MLNPDQARDMGRRSGEARRAQRSSKLNLARVEADLPPMDSPSGVKRRLEVLVNWAAAGLLPGSVANAAIRGCEVWFKVHDLETERQRVKGLEDRVKELATELETARKARLHIG